MKSFERGRLVITQGIMNGMNESADFSKEVTEAFTKYIFSDWGDTCKQDWVLNDEAVKGDDRIVAKYKTCKGDIFIITEWDKSYTTILFGSEY